MSGGLSFDDGGPDLAGRLISKVHRSTQQQQPNLGARVSRAVDRSFGFGASGSMAAAGENTTLRVAGRVQLQNLESAPFSLMGALSKP